MSIPDHPHAGHPLDKQLAELAELRGEIGLAAHLLGEEAQEQWHKAESRWEQLQQELRAARGAVDRSAPEVKAAAQLLISTLHESYSQLREALRH